MEFRKAWFELLDGKHIKLPSWSGYWAWEDNSIKMHTHDGKVIDIRNMDNVAYTFSNVASCDWIIAED